MARTIAFLSGKGGVGKTFLCASLGASLVSDFRKRVLLVDCNFTSPGLGVFLNIVKPAVTLYNVLTEGVPTASAIVSHDTGLNIIPFSLSVRQEIDLGKLASALSQVAQNYDFILIDSAGTISAAEIAVANSADSSIVVVTPDLPSATGAMKLIGTLQSSGRAIEGIVLNRVTGKSRHELRPEELESSTKLKVLASVPEDRSVPESVFARTPAVLYAPFSQASISVRNLAADLCGAAHFEKPGLFQSFARKKSAAPAQKASPHLEGLRDSVVQAAPAPPVPAAQQKVQPQSQFQTQPQIQPVQVPQTSQSSQVQPSQDKQRTKDEYMKQWMEGKITLDQMMEKVKELEK
jgi:septum site-determining protein MinD